MNSENKSGMLIALAGFASFSVGDSVVKSMAGDWPIFAIGALRFTAGALGLAIFLMWKEGARGFRMPMPGYQLLRGVCMSCGAVSFFGALFLMPLADAVAIQFTSPMITVMLSALFLRERTSKSSWLAIIMAFVGVVIVLRPNVAEFGWSALLPVSASFFFAIYMIVNRKVASAGSALQMQFLAAGIASPIFIIAAFFAHRSGVEEFAVQFPDWAVVWKCVAFAFIATTGHWLVFIGTKLTSAARVAPMIYVQILVATAIGMAVFDEWPDIISVCGTLIIIAAGLFLFRSNARQGLAVAR